MAQDKTKKPSFLERFASHFGFKKETKPTPYFETIDLGDSAVRVVQGKQLQARLECMEALVYRMSKPIPTNLTPKQRVKELKERLDGLNTGIQVLSVAWGRSMDGNNRSGKLFAGWNSMFAFGSSLITRTQLYEINDDASVQNEGDNVPLSQSNMTCHNLEFTLIHHIFSDAFNVLDFCFSERDVRAQAIAVVQSMAPPNPQGSGVSVNRETDGL